jgi:hypothetical protein
MKIIDDIINDIFNIIESFTTRDQRLTRLYKYNKSQRDWEDALDKEFPIDAFFKKFYINIRSLIYNVPDMPKDGYRKIKRGFQRGYRGWSDDDVWEMFAFNSRVIYQMMLKLKADKHGYPCTLPNPETFQFGDGSKLEDEWYNKNEEEWNKILDQIIYAFKLNMDIANGDREVYSKYWSEKDRQEFNGLTLQEEIDRRIGMQLFVEHYFSLWD